MLVMSSAESRFAKSFGISDCASTVRVFSLSISEAARRVDDLRENVSSFRRPHVFSPSAIFATTYVVHRLGHHAARRPRRGNWFVRETIF